MELVVGAFPTRCDYKTCSPQRKDSLLDLHGKALCINVPPPADGLADTLPHPAAPLCSILRMPRYHLVQSILFPHFPDTFVAFLLAFVVK